MNYASRRTHPSSLVVSYQTLNTGEDQGGKDMLELKEAGYEIGEEVGGEGTPLFSSKQGPTPMLSFELPLCFAFF